MSVRYVPCRLRLACRLLAVVILMVFVVGAVTLPDAPRGARTGVGDEVAVALLGVLLAAGVLFLSRPVVAADETHLYVRNIIGSHCLPWSAVLAVRLDEGAHWARLDLPDDEYLAVMALQLMDKQYAVHGVLELRRLLTASRQNAAQ